ncbi:phosphatidyl inositol kinase [Apophysomyces ossiformis]|uniref:Phosphatidylinositol 4-kinase n=1 Tax=Apophysomyces ossiformis TaxID=679940 RepID=A0A8H7EUH0_9FUNG|nr:phosphatidyl inositol kinase [Apophysomyces ossiformis]
MALGSYTRLQQQDDADDELDYEDLVAAISHHPNSILIANEDRCSIAPRQPQPLPDLAVSSKPANLPTATRDFLKSKLPNVVFGKSKNNRASFLPPVILADMQAGHLHAQEEDLLMSRGWKIVRRRRFRGRGGVGETQVGKKARNKRPDVSIRTGDNNQLSSSVFVPCTDDSSDIPTMSMTSAIVKPQDEIPVTKEEYLEIVQAVRTAIDAGTQPTRISQGSSGSYFSRDKTGKIVGVFKPKNEEPYGHLNPKWTKWIHRHLFPCFFGRSCLIPNLGYLSEAASSLIDRRLGTMIVPYTDVVHLASPAFHYDYLDRRLSPHGLPPKIGSFQCFLEGYKDANLFLRDHPFPVDSTYSSLSFTGSNVWGCFQQDDNDDNESEEDFGPPRPSGSSSYSEGKFRWTSQLQSQFKHEFEKLVILDYLIRNTDRGLDNWMIKYCDGSAPEDGKMPQRPHIHIAAIDNGLAFPFKHPDEWRSYPYGWLALPEPLIARPFSEATRRHFLGVLSDPLWWRETVRGLRDVFEMDSDFDERMFECQMAVLKGQGYNLVRVLKDRSTTPLDLVATERILVNQEEILIEYDERILAERDPNRQSPTQRLRRKRSTSFHVVPTINDSADTELSQHPSGRWKDRMKSRLSVDFGRRRKFKKSLWRGLRQVGSDGEEDDGDSSDSDSEDEKCKRATLVMETIQVVKSKKPYFTCC